MKKLISILAVSVGFTCLGNEPENNTKTLLGINLSPDYAYRTLKSNEASANWLKSLRNNSEGPKFGYSVGANVKYFMSPDFAFEAGIQYSNKGYKIKRKELNYANMLDPRYEFEYTMVENLPSYAEAKINFTYIEIPMRYIYHAGSSKIKYLFSLGISPAYLLNASQTNIYEYSNGIEVKNTAKDKQNNYKKINIFTTASAGINYSFNEKINISAEPVFRYGMLDIIDAPLTGKLWNAGLNCTFYYKLK